MASCRVAHDMALAAHAYGREFEELVEKGVYDALGCQLAECSTHDCVGITKLAILEVVGIVSLQGTPQPLAKVRAGVVQHRIQEAV